MNIVLLGFIYVLGAVFVSLAGLAVVRRTFGPEKMQSHHDVAGFIYAILGVIYAVLLAFVVIVVWEQFEAAGEKAVQEAGSVASVYRLAHEFPTPVERDLKRQTHEYVETVVTKEWPLLASGNQSPQVDDILNEMHETLDSVQPVTIHENAVYMALMDKLNELGNQRRERVLSSNEGLPTIMWIVLFFGAFMTIGFTYFFAPDNYGAHVLMLTMLSATIGIVLFLISAIDRPFTGSLRVEPDALEHVAKSMAGIDARDKLTHQSTSRVWSQPPPDR